MNNSDLIERLKDFLDRRRGMMSVSDERLVKGAIDALSPVLPGEVAEEIEALRKLAKLQGNGLLAEHSHADKTADLIERLARAYESSVRLWEGSEQVIDKLQQRIEELSP